MAEEGASTRHVETRRLAAIMFTDIVGFSRQMGADEARMLRLLDVHNRIIQQAVAEHHGTVIKTVGDAFLVDFPSVVHAVQSAQRIQSQFKTHNAGKEAAEQIHVRIGIHLGDIVPRGGDMFGDGVNIASRLQGLAEPDTVCISDVVYRDVAKKLDLGTVVSLGKPKLKNIAERVAVYALLPEAPRGVGRVLQGQRVKLTRWRRPIQIAAAALIVMWAGVVTHRLFSPVTPTGQPEEVTPTNPQPALPLPDKPSIVVLPFANMSNDPGQDYFSDGITEDLTMALSQLSSLFVIARNSAFIYKGKAVKVQDVSRELGVRYVLEGSVRKADHQIRVTAQLIDATTGYHLWSERYDRPLQDIFALQDEIVQKIATTLKLQLAAWEQGIMVRKTTENLDAYDAYLRGMSHFLRGTKEESMQARQLFERAIALDPQYAAAYASLGFTYWLSWWLQWSPSPQTLTHAFELAQKAVALKEALPAPHMILGFVYLMQKQHEQAREEAERAIALDPNFALAHVLLGDILVFGGRPQEATRSYEKAMRLNPHSPGFYANGLATAYLLMKRYEEAIALLRQIVSHNPNLLQAHWNLAIAYSELGREAEARAEAAEILRLSPNFSVEVLRQAAPFKDPAVIEPYLAALRKAGLK